MAVVVALVSAAATTAAPKKVDSWIGSSSSGTLQGEFNVPTDATVDESTGDLYVADSSNHRVQRFSATGIFQLMWGKNVLPGGGTGFEVCTAADTPCQAGEETGDEQGEFNHPTGVAIGPDGSIYVLDRDNQRIQKFTDTDTTVEFELMFGSGVDQTTPGDVCLAANDCQAGIAGGSAGQLGGTGSPVRLAIDPARDNDVFVGDAGNRRIAQYDSNGIFDRAWGWDVVPGGSPAFEICTAASTCQPALAPDPFSFDSPPNGQFPDNSPLHVAVDCTGDVYASDPGAGFFASPRLQRFDSTKADAADLLIAPFFGTFDNLEVDSAADHLLAGSSSGVRQLDTSTSPPAMVTTHLAGSGVSPTGLGASAPSTIAGRLYVPSQTGGHRVYIADDDGGPVPAVTIDEPTNVTSSAVTFSGTVNPNAFPNSYRFEYSKDGANWTPAKADEDVGQGTTAVPVDDDVTGLEANTDYQVRLIATPAFGNDPVVSPVRTFKTDAIPPTVTTLPDRGASDTAATLAGRINPHRLSTAYHFDYGTTTAYGNTAPDSASDAGSGGAEQTVFQLVEELEPETLYHYRLVATNAEGTTFGADQTFITRPAAQTPSGRAYELVSPADKIGGQGVGNYQPGDGAAEGPGFPSRDGRRYAVSGSTGITLLDGKFAYANDWAFAERNGDLLGWQSHSPFTHKEYGAPSHRFAAIRAASPTLSLLAWGSNGGHLSVFPEVGAFPQIWDVPTLGSWEGQYEVVAPTDLTQGNPGRNAPLISADGSYVVQSTDDDFKGGLSGSDDPNLARAAGPATYVDDVSNGLSDTFPGKGVREPVGVCDSGTLIPNVDIAGKLATRSCPSPAPGLNATLVDNRGVATAVPGSFGGRRNPGNILSRDASRIFFRSPASTTFVPEVEQTPCDGTEESTKCPSQLYVRYEDSGGDVATRWISRPEVPGQDASLLGAAILEGATPDGDKVFFRTNSPLTSDDPNGTGSPPPPGGVTTGDASFSSWDLYLYDFTDDSQDDPGNGDLTRVSAGPNGSDANNAGGSGVFPDKASLRFLSENGDHAYFVTSGILDGVPAPADPTRITTPGGDPDNQMARNLYHYEREGNDESWTFVARLPSENDIQQCATTGAGQGEPITVGAGAQLRTEAGPNCTYGTADGSFVTFLTDGRLTSDDPVESTTVDLYGYDAASRSLVRLSAAQGGGGEPYTCATDTSTFTDVSCHADSGLSGGALSRLGVVSDPANSGDRIAFFQSKSRLVSEDTDSEYDVYQWRNGDLLLLSPGTETPAYYNGSDASGENVFIQTRDRLTWQDLDAVHDIYTARVGGGIPEPPALPAPCAILADACQGAAIGVPTSTKAETDKPGGDGDASPGARKTLRVGKPSRKARRRAARTGKLAVVVRVSEAGKVSAVAKGRIGKRTRRVARKSVQVRKAGVTRIKLRLSRAARQRLSRGQALKLSIKVTSPGARSRSIAVRLPGGKS